MFDPHCIGALVTKYQAGKWTKKDYEKYGPNYRMMIEGIYLYDFWNCRLFRVFKKEELFNKGGCRKIPGGFFRDSIVSLGDGRHYIAMLAQPKMSLGHNNLPTFRYSNIAIKEKESGLRTITVHQTTEMLKRELQIDSRGQLADYVARMLGHPGKTIDEIFPIVGCNTKAEAGYEYESRLDFIPYKNQNEIGDVEHPLYRDRLKDNGCLFGRATNHCINVLIGTTQHHEINGTRDHNFAHIHRDYKHNKILDEESRKVTKYRQKKKFAKRKRPS